jgi:transcriptional regulator of PTS gene
MLVNFLYQHPWKGGDTIKGRNVVDVRRFNLGVILNTIRLSDNISRNILANKTGLTKTTVSAIVNEFIEKGVITEKGEGLASTKGGRRPISLKIIPNSLVAAGINIRREKISAVLLNTNSKILTQRSFFVNDRSSVDGIFKKIYECLDQILAEKPQDSTLIGIGVGAAGPLDLDKGKILSPLDFGAWRNVHLKDNLINRYNMPVFVETGACAGALSEHFWRASDDHKLDYLLFVEVDAALGFGMIIDGKIVHGLSSAGEIGHMVVNPSGEACNCGLNGCLDLYASGLSILKNLGKVDFAANPGTMRNSNWGQLLEDITKDQRCEAVVRRAAEYLGLEIVNLFNLLSPQWVVLGSTNIAFIELYKKHLISYLTDVHTLEQNIVDRIKIAKYGVNAIEVGAATLVFHEFYKDPKNFLAL